MHKVFYKLGEHGCETICPYNIGIYVGSIRCGKCKHYVSMASAIHNDNILEDDSLWINCNHTKEEICYK